jgi:sec-independent protein translocase protein TatA
MPNIGIPELLILLVVLLVIFGPKRLPGLGRSVGEGMREFKDSVTGKSKDDEPVRAELEPAQTAAAPSEPAAAPAETAATAPAAEPAGEPAPGAASDRGA